MWPFVGSMRAVQAKAASAYMTSPHGSDSRKVRRKEAGVEDFWRASSVSNIYLLHL
jgi:hypothetical protein